MNTTLPASGVTIFWFRRDLRLEDNTGLYHALRSGRPVLPLFIFDRDILDRLETPEDRRVVFIHERLQALQQELVARGSTLLALVGRPVEVWEQVLNAWPVAAVYFNHDYEPYARRRDTEIQALLRRRGIPCRTFKDQVIFEKEEILNRQGRPYTVFTPYRKAWKARWAEVPAPSWPSVRHLDALLPHEPLLLPALESLGFRSMKVSFPPEEVPDDVIRQYHLHRDYPAREGTTRLGVHLRFGSTSIRRWVRKGWALNETFLDQLIWREFFMMLLWHFPDTVEKAFRPRWRHIPWVFDEEAFRRWQEGRTGFPLVDAGMRQLRATGYMHNRVRMVVANFLTKLLRMDWRLGEAHFAAWLLDYEQASNVGNWQWSAGCGVDAAPYFRIFNPEAQRKRYDPDGTYVRRRVPEWRTPAYPPPMFDYARQREESLAWFRTHLQRAQP